MLSEITIIVICMLAAIILLIAEVFFIPGITLAGIAGALCAGGGIWYAYSLDMTIGHITVLSSIIGFVAVFWFFVRSRSFKIMELNADISSKVTSNLEQGISVGEKGVTVSRLASVGKARFNRTIVEVKAENGWIDENTPVLVTRIEDNYIWVITDEQADETENSIQ
ncbi:MAG: NfeD family protein [Parabacteroides sp.]|nr:NfeD family protein [Parabacteroides sp.]